VELWSTLVPFWLRTSWTLSVFFWVAICLSPIRR
jgi:hypothetical protein